MATQVVGQNPHVESCAAFNTSYTDSGLFGVYGVCHPDKAGDMSGAICKALTGLTTVADAELATAKAMLKGKLRRDADDSSALMQDLGSQILALGSYSSPADLSAAVDGVSAAGVAGVVRKLLSSKPTVAAFGDTHAVPSYAAIEASLKA